MSYFAELDETEIVLRVVVAEKEYIDSGKMGDPSRFVETDMEGRKNIRYAGIGYTFDNGRSAFIPPKPHKSWVLDEKSKDWRAPKEMPRTSKKHNWDESKLEWIETTEQREF